jgi:hypothetical protein
MGHLRCDALRPGPADWSRPAPPGPESRGSRATPHHHDQDGRVCRGAPTAAARRRRARPAGLNARGGGGGDGGGCGARPPRGPARGLRAGGFVGARRAAQGADGDARPPPPAGLGGWTGLRPRCEARPAHGPAGPGRAGLLRAGPGRPRTGLGPAARGAQAARRALPLAAGEPRPPGRRSRKERKRKERKGPGWAGPGRDSSRRLRPEQSHPQALVAGRQG